MINWKLSEQDLKLLFTHFYYSILQQCTANWINKKYIKQYQLQNG